MSSEAIDLSRTVLPAAAAAGRIRGIDGLRAIAAISVYLLHAGLPFAQRGGIGVDVFFVISGFVITRSLLAEYDHSRAIDIAAFYVRRAVRLWPALAVMVMTFALIDPARVSLKYEILPSLLYYSNWTRAFDFGGPVILGHTWTLSVEEQFYLVWPLVLLACLRWRSHAVAIVLALAASSAVWRAFLFLHGHSGNEVFHRFDTRFDGLMLGTALALMSASTVRKAGRLFPVAVLCLAVVVYNYHWPKDWLFLGGYLLVGVAAATVLSRIVSDQQGALVQGLEWAPLAFFGRISYGFYLWHLPVLLALPGFGLTSWQKVLAQFLITLGFALLSWFLIEIPAKRFLLPRWAIAAERDSSHPSRSPSATGA